jgi:Ca2+-dependent lipid-binding protein
MEDDVVVGRLKVVVIKARDLVSRDLFGYPSPQAKVSFGEEHCQTRVVRNSLNPVWASCFMFNVSERTLKESILIEVWHRPHEIGPLSYDCKNKREETAKLYLGKKKN